MKMRKRVLFLLIDGVADRPVPQLDNMTPLQIADAPALDYLATTGMVGNLHPIGPGIPPASDSGHLSILGYALEAEYPGRGFLEALGEGIDVGPDSVVFRSNFATVRVKGEELLVVDRRAGRISGKDAEELSVAISKVELLGGEARATFRHTLEHRGIVMIEGLGLSPNLTEVDPHDVGYPVLDPQPIGDEKEARKTAMAVREFVLKTHRILRDHEVNRSRSERGLLPANALLLRGASCKSDFEPFESRWGFKAVAIATGPLYKGIARALGMRVMEVEGATGLPNSNFRGKVGKALELLSSGFDFAFVHMKGTDVASHQKDPELKVKVIERINDALEPLLSPPEDLLTVVTGDHATPCLLGKHSGDPVPVLMSGNGMPRDDVGRFDEARAMRGGLGTILGKDVMRLVLNYSNRSGEHPLRLMKRDVAYMPSKSQLKALKLGT